MVCNVNSLTCNIYLHPLILIINTPPLFFPPNFRTINYAYTFIPPPRVFIYTGFNFHYNPSINQPTTVIPKLHITTFGHHILTGNEHLHSLLIHITTHLRPHYPFYGRPQQKCTEINHPHVTKNKTEMQRRVGLSKSNNKFLKQTIYSFTFFSYFFSDYGFLSYWSTSTPNPKSVLKRPS